MHNIDGQRFVGYRTPAWHNLGTVVLDVISVEEAIQRGDIDFEYIKVPIGYTTPSGLFVNSSNKVAVLRAPRSDDEDWKELGVVSDSYHFLQNIELARGLDTVAAKTGWRFETVGALGDGATVFMTLAMGKGDVKGDDIELYLMVLDGKASGKALSVQVVIVRPVCQNTVAAAQASALRMIKLRHDAQVATNYVNWLEIIPAIEQASRTSIEELTEMASKKITIAGATAIIDAAFPEPVKNDQVKQAEELMNMPHLSITKRDAILASLAGGIKAYEDFSRLQHEKRESAMVLYQRFNAGREEGLKTHTLKPGVLSEIRETPYAALQAITELVDWGGTANAKSAAAGALFGNGAEAKLLAWGKALEVARS